jgi:hypothetical protein
MDVALIATLIAATVSIIGWIVNYLLTGKAERQRQRLSASLEHIEKQLEELYGPLAFWVMDGKDSYADLLGVLGRDEVFIDDKELTPGELKAWLFWIENDIFPRHERIQTLLSTKTHLIEGDKVPQSYLDFLKYFNSWRMSHLRWKKEGKKYSWQSRLDPSEDFAEDVISTFEKLKVRHSQLLGKTSE